MANQQFRFIGSAGNGYSVTALPGLRSIGDVLKVDGGWNITITTPPPTEKQWDANRGYWYTSCMCGKETLPKTYGSRKLAAEAGLARYREVYPRG